MIIPATHLPSTGGVLAGVSAINMSLNGPLTYASLAITAAHTNAKTLSTTFAANLTNPVTCQNAKNLKVNYKCCPSASREWAP